MVELRVADLAVLGLLGGAQLLDPRVLATLSLTAPAQRHADRPRNEGGEHDQGECVLHAQRGYLPGGAAVVAGFRLRGRRRAAAARPAKPPTPATARGPRARRRGCGPAAAAPPATATPPRARPARRSRRRSRSKPPTARRSRRSPQRTSTSLVASPSKKREMAPSEGSPLE